MNINIKSFTLKSEYLDYEISFDTDGAGNVDTRTVTYGQPIGELPNVSKDGYTFNGWKDQDGNVVTENTIVKGKLDLEAEFTVKEYNIAYNLDNGTVTPSSANPTKYTVEDEFELVNPTRKGYTFAGWTEGESENLYTRVTISHETGTKAYTAHWSKNQNTKYYVNHKYPNLDGTYETVREELTGPTDTEVTAPFKPKTGFVNPTTSQNLTISADEDSEVTYTYTRHEYNLTLNDDIETTFTNSTYPYETEITLTAKDKANYEFTGWSNGETTKTIIFNITEDTNVYPEYVSTLITVTFNPNGGTVDETTRSVNKETAIGELPTPTAQAGKDFDAWYTELTGGTKVTSSYIVNNNITIYARYTDQTFTITFDTDGGTSVDNQTITYGNKVTKPTTNPTKEGYTFDDWYTDTNYNTLFDFNTEITSDTIIYAKFKTNPFPVVFSEPGECTFNGSSGVLTEDNCSYANGTNKYIDTGINLYNEENHDKDYEIGFTIVSYNSSEQTGQATFMNTKLEGNNYPGLVFRKRNNYSQLDLSSRKTSSANEVKYLGESGVETVKIYRIYNEQKDAQEIYLQINDEDKVLVNDLSKYNPTFDLSVWFGAAPTNVSATSAQRFLNNTTLSNMYIKLGTYQEESTEKYKITYNANGGSVSPASKKINIGDSVGTLPTPTAPTGKSFSNWYTGLTDGTVVTSSYTPNSNITIYARYYKDVTGATVSPSSISLIKGNEETLIVSNVEEEYTFSSNDENIATVDQTGKVTGTGVGTTTITITGSTSGKTKTIEVTVEASTYTVTLNTQDGTLTQTYITQEIGTPIGELPVPTPPENYEFDAWYTELTGGIEVTSSYMPNSNVTIYARYTENVCKTFSTDSWNTIKTNLESDSEYYAVGCEKEVELDMDDDGANESYTVRLANTSTPSVCSTEGYSQTACGTVIEFIDFVTLKRMNPTDTNAGGWKESEMVTYLNSDFYNKLPNDIKSLIIPTYPIVSSSGKTGVSADITATDTDKNKIYLLSSREIGVERDWDNKNDVTTDTRTLDYYDLNNNNESRIKYNLDGLSKYWWTRSASNTTNSSFISVITTGNPTVNPATDTTKGIAPAFRIGTMPTFTVSFNTDGGSSVSSQTIKYGNKVTKPTTNPTKSGYTFDNWYTDDTYTTKFDFDTPITSDTTIYAHFEELKVCANNVNITRLSKNTCSNNENITVGDGIICKRAVKLHEETCSQTDGTYHCSGAGYTESGSKGTSTITYGSCGTSGTLNSGDAFTCDVNGDGDFDELTERFYYVSDYYDTSAKEFDDSTAVLIYYNNVTSGVACNKNTFAYSNAADIQTVDPTRTYYDNWHGPLTVMKQLPTTSQWSNISLKSDTRAILGEDQSTHDSPTTTGGTLPTNFSYEGYAARLLTAKELMAGCNLTEVVIKGTTGDLDICNYIMENTKYAKSSIGSYGPWLETPNASDYYGVWVVNGSNRYVNDFNASGTSYFGARPAIEVPKSKISY